MVLLRVVDGAGGGGEQKEGPRPGRSVELMSVLVGDDVGSEASRARDTRCKAIVCKMHMLPMNRDGGRDTSVSLSSASVCWRGRRGRLSSKN